MPIFKIIFLITVAILLIYSLFALLIVRSIFAVKRYADARITVRERDGLSYSLTLSYLVQHGIVHLGNGCDIEYHSTRER